MPPISNYYVIQQQNVPSWERVGEQSGVGFDRWLAVRESWRGQESPSSALVPPSPLTPAMATADSSKTQPASPCSSQATLRSLTSISTAFSTSPPVSLAAAFSSSLHSPPETQFKGGTDNDHNQLDVDAVVDTLVQPNSCAFDQPVPLKIMVDILNELWECEGMYD